MSAQRPARCGTPSGYRKHQHAGERPCDACAAAKSEYDRRLRSAPEATRRNRLTAQAQNHARTRLTAIYPDVYAALYREEKERIWRENGLPLEVVREW